MQIERTSWRTLVAVPLLLAAVAVVLPAPAYPADPPNVAVTDLAHRSYQHYSLARDPSNPQRLALTYVNGVYATNNSDKHNMCAVAISEDGGSTWRRDVLVGVAPPEGQARNPEVHGRFQLDNEDFRTCRTPTQEVGTVESPPRIAFAPDGTIYVVVGVLTLAGSTTVPKIFVFRSRDNGVTYQGLGCDDVPVDCRGTWYVPPGEAVDRDTTAHDKFPDVQVDPATGRVYLVWNRFYFLTTGTLELLAVYGDNAPGGRFELSPPTVIPERSVPPRQFTSEQLVTVAPAEAPDSFGRMYVAWVDPEDQNLRDTGGLGADVWLNSSVDGGETFGEPTRVAAALAPRACTGTPKTCEDLYYNWSVEHPELFSIAAGPESGRLYVAWYDRKTPGERNRLHFRASSDAGQTFTAATLVGIPQGKDDDEQHRPSLSVAPNGRIDLAYYDISAADANGVRLHDVYLTSSCDKGATFTTPQRVRDVEPWDASLGSPVLVGQLTSGKVAPVGRLGVVSSEAAASVAWTDSRRTIESGDPLKQKQDVFFGTVTPACGAGVLPTTTLPPTTLPPTTLPSTGTTSPPSTTSSGATASSASDGRGYSLVASDGGVFSFNFPFSGSTGNLRLNKPIVGAAADPDGKGYWMVASDGGVFAFDAPFYGSTGNMALNQPIVAMAADPGGRGYYLVAADGGVFAFGPGARFRGSTGNLRLNKPIVAAAADRDGSGYWLFASDGGVFAFDAPYSGSTGNIRLAQPIVGAAADRDGRGYHLVASDGGVFAFGAAFHGSTGNLRLNQPIVAMAAA